MMKTKIDELKKMLPSIPDAVKNLRKESKTSLCGPCPKCGGDDRFVYRNDTQSFWCRQCNEKGGDVINFHAWIEGTDVKGLMKKYLPEDEAFIHYQLGEPIEKYPYTDAQGIILYYNCRFEPKAFRQCSADGLKWSTKNIKPKVPYQLPKVIEAETVFIVEGERDCHNLEKLDLVATCNVAGAGNWTKDLNQHFKGKEIFLIPDNDDAGRKHVAKVFENLKNVAVGYNKLIELPGLPDGGDFTDWLNTFEDIDDAGERFAIMVDGAGPYKPPREMSLNDCVMTTSQFSELDIPNRKELLFPWLKEDSINLISGWRGCGKTWFALGILDSVTRGGKFGAWECKKSVPCLFLDGEMTRSDVNERIKNLELQADRENPLYVLSGALLNDAGLPAAHLAKESWRQEMKQILLSRKVKLWAVDNLASLASGLDENKKQDWDPINQWLLELRFAGISTLILHHLGKGGVQRGTSAREDNLDISMILRSPHDYIPEDGARFITNFTKGRVSTKNLNLIGDTEFKLIINETGGHVWTHKNTRQGLMVEVIQKLDEGLKQKNIAEDLGVTAGRVSQLKKRAISDKLITPKGTLTPSGFDFINVG